MSSWLNCPAVIKSNSTRLLTSVLYCDKKSLQQVFHETEIFSRDGNIFHFQNNFHLGTEWRKIIQIASKDSVNGGLVPRHGELALSPAHVIIIFLVDNKYETEYKYQMSSRPVEQWCHSPGETASISELFFFSN